VFVSIISLENLYEIKKSMENTGVNCIKLLHDQFVPDFSQIDNLSKVMHNAR
jgi:hypothetical protein